METCASRPSGMMDTAKDTTTTSRSASDTAELERCRSKALDLAHDYNKENGKLQCLIESFHSFVIISRSNNPASQQWEGNTGSVRSSWKRNPSFLLLMQSLPRTLILRALAFLPCSSPFSKPRKAERWSEQRIPGSKWQTQANPIAGRHPVVCQRQKLSPECAAVSMRGLTCTIWMQSWKMITCRTVTVSIQGVARQPKTCCYGRGYCCLCLHPDHLHCAAVSSIEWLKSDL